MSPGTDGVSRRDVLKAAVAVGGASALSACLDFVDEPVPEGPSDLSTLPTRQHAWEALLTRDGAENVELPRHQTLLYLTLDRDGTPTPADRRAVESALTTLDRAYERSNEGLIHSLAFSPAYFSRFDESLPDSLDLPEPRALSPFETPTFDRQDALLHLASDRADALLEAEEALTGERDTANGVTMETPLSAVFSVDSRRTGFIGKGMPAERQDVRGIPDSNPVPEESPLFMGFKAGFAKNQATEEYVTIPDGPFAGATTKHVSKLRQRLEDWYVEQEFDDRVAEMFSPEHAAENLVDGVGDNLGDSSGVTPDIVDRIREHAQEYGRVGHAQKAARANRDEAGNVRLLRRHFESTDENEASLHFPSLQRRMTDFEEVRRAMNGTDLTDEPAIRQRVNNGILEYIFVKNRGNFLVPPRRLRALPTPMGEVPGL
ncbi:Tat pathway signal protein [Haloprofundus marisrubri]|uniref:Tat pathway signal protein n=1 Tax=Haloprofundus marisrubri TaxID=1514971 RepID=A0A0W1RAA5_9EURY|nr:twin-arginine translocation signal domain-containing protein [Haloprofundus marisrubri]KTG10273.1 Tat pathway signal protein [Haloprofundus marisrubri]